MFGSPPRRGSTLAVVLLVTALLPLAFASPAAAAGGDLFADGIDWCASTHPNHGTLPGFGPALDLGSPDDFRRPVYAPGDGDVKIHSEGWGGGWGNSIIWTRADGDERIHMAHLDEFAETGSVEAGDLIGYVGATGQATGPHVHASAQVEGKPWPLHLQGKEIEAGECYTSPGPIPPLCRGFQATLIGGPGPDAIVGTSGRDVILARGGDDSIEAKGDADVVCGGGGDDVVLGGGGGDDLSGGDGPDTVKGGKGADVVRGSGGSDLVAGGGAMDRILGKAGGDLVLGGKKADELVGGAGPDDLRGGPGNDLAEYGAAGAGVTASLKKGTASGQGNDELRGVEDLLGSSWDDHLTGDAEDNSLFGGPGNDDLVGLGGTDFVNGGAGKDDCSGEQSVNCDP
jgi:Ca2+-binding RTX toxin-like protein